MALPVILVDSATGSDTAASGAGPSTALTGSAASTDGTGLVVTLNGSPDLTGVATDGSHVIFVNDTTAGARNFGKITAKDNTAKTVTVSNAFGLSISSKSWAIGGKRASIGATTSRKLFDNNSASGDAMTGWIVEMAAGHTEILSSVITMRRAASTDGPITLRGASSGTKPVLTWTSNSLGIDINTNGNAYVLDRFTILNSNVSKGSAYGITIRSGCQGTRISRITCGNSTNYWLESIYIGERYMTVELCEVSYGSIGIDVAAGMEGLRLLANQIKNCTSHGILIGSEFQGSEISGNVIAACGGRGIYQNGPGRYLNGSHISNNTIDSCTSHGIEITSTPATDKGPFCIENNSISNNGGYGVNFSSGSATAALLSACDWRARFNGIYSNTSGACNPSGYDTDTNTSNPNYANAGSNDYSIGTNLKAAGWPQENIGSTGGTRSYVDPGAAQRQEAGGSSGGITSQHNRYGSEGVLSL